MLGLHYMLVTLHSMRSKLCAVRPETQNTAHGGTDAATSAQKALEDSHRWRSSNPSSPNIAHRPCKEYPHQILLLITPTLQLRLILQVII